MAIKEDTLKTDAPAAEQSTMTSEVFYYSPSRFLRAMFAIAWSAFAHPFSATVIDLETGQVWHEVVEERG
jgi:hypothetical protein